MNKPYTLTIRGSQSSALIRSHIQELFTGLAESVSSHGVRRFHISLSVENGPAAPGPDHYRCTILAYLSRGGTLRISEEGGSLYDAATECFSSIRVALLERKRNLVDRRNDISKLRVARGGVL